MSMQILPFQPQADLAVEQAPRLPERTYLNVAFGVKSWLLTTDHKRIAILYLISVTLMFFVGGATATLIRLHLLTPSGQMFPADTYNKLFSAHGIVMVFFFMIPAIPAILGNFLLPMMIGARDLAFPRINLASWYCYMAGALIMLWVLLGGGIDTGWTFYAPFSTKSAHTNVIATGVAAIIAGFSSIFTGLNFVVTVHRLRAPGLTWFRMPLFIWSLYATSIIILLGTPVVAMLVILMIVERAWGIGIFDPALGGDPVLFQHLFWFYSHPAVYIMILPAMAVTSEIIPCFSRKNIFGYAFIAFASIAIAVLGFLVWAHHMFVAGQSVYASLIFSLLTMLVAVPSAIKVFNWTATLYKGSISLQTPMVFALGFMALFTMGGLTGLMLGALGLDVHVHDTYFIIAHFHFIMVGGTVMAYLGGIHYWWPKMTGRMYSEWLGRLSASIIFIGFVLTFVPQFVLGYLGMPRRIPVYPQEWQVLNVLSSAGASILAVGYLLPFSYLLYSLYRGPIAGPNPWGATGLEWQTPSPPPPENFPEPPVVTCGPYEYSMHSEGDHGH